jgi:hypothetical protein
MKILRFYWDSDKQESVNDRVLTVIRETKTQLVAIARTNPKCEYRFRKPSKLVSGTRLTPVGRQRDRFSMFRYELYLESGCI